MKWRFHQVGSVLLLSMIFSNCVDLPNEGHIPPDYRSVVRYLHVGRGIDTIALLIRSSTVTTSSTSTVVSGSDTIKTIRDTTRSFTTYRRLRVDLLKDLTVVTDGNTIGTLSGGATTQYLDTPSGSRKVSIQASGVAIDSLQVRDTLVAIRVDTVKAGGLTRTFRDFIERKNNFLFPYSGNVTAVIDTTVSPINIGTEHKATVFLIGDIAARDTSRNGLVRYGWIRYVYSADRRTFDSPGLPDTGLVRFCNASALLGRASISALGTSLGIGNLSFASVSGYLGFPARQDTSYRVAVGTPPTSDTLQLTVFKGKRQTVVFVDSAGTTVKRVYLDE